MTLDRDAKLFIGLKLQGRIRDAYDASRNAGYVGENGAGNFLTIFEAEGNRYLGKLMDAGLSTDRIEDVTRNVLSILGRLVEGERLPAALAIFAVAP